MKLALLTVIFLASTALAGPQGHPRIILDKDLKAAWHAQAADEHGPVIGAIKLCKHGRETKEHDHGIYRGSEWVKLVQACLVSWAATDNKDDATTAIKFMTALLDDENEIGDGKGGDGVVQHDDGFPIRMIGPWTAIAYDWLYDQLTPALRTKAEGRWRAWLGWYREKGYRKESPGTNYHAGYLFAATMIALATGDDGAVKPMWEKDMAVAFTDDGVLAGGAWPEGWQYGPLAVAEIAFSARALRQAGANVRMGDWLDQLFKVHVYGLTPSDRVFPGGDTEEESSAYLTPNPLVLDAVAFGDASPDDKRWARGELSRLKLVDVDWLMFDALAAVGDKPQLAPRASWPTSYIATAVRRIYARANWNADSVWFVAECSPTLDVDHRLANAGNFALSRGKDEVIVDPSPYGSQSTLTSNAPTIRSPQLPKNYQPGQAYWSDKTGWEFLTQRASGIVAGRCNYADQYKFQERKSDIPEALRDIVMIPTADGKDAAVVVIDKANTDSADNHLFLRFRSPSVWAINGAMSTTRVGGSNVSVQTFGATPTLGRTNVKDCFKEGTDRGNCDASRIPGVTDVREEIAGPTPFVINVIGAVGGDTIKTTELKDKGVQLSLRNAAVIYNSKSGYPALPNGVNVVLDASDTATPTAKKTGDHCDISISGTGTGGPLIFALDDNCGVTADKPSAATPLTNAPSNPSTSRVRVPRDGCCDASSGPVGPTLTGALVLLFIRRKKLKKS
ncbi:MAG: hypothetical protein QM831_17360 [Kofleriaceae bacterium]